MQTYRNKTNAHLPIFERVSKCAVVVMSKYIYYKVVASEQGNIIYLVWKWHPIVVLCKCCGAQLSRELLKTGCKQRLEINQLQTAETRNTMSALGRPWMSYLYPCWSKKPIVFQICVSPDFIINIKYVGTVITSALMGLLPRFTLDHIW